MRWRASGPGVRGAGAPRLAAPELTSGAAKPTRANITISVPAAELP